ncbi:hypothetical protein M514_05900 [Trichuris suis]|uniref:Uncharacterized protein n=1 Tax=Trichuris suis TaxID=68888 RepID=A0A085M7J4_9BILA|nr:hypothetical protein M513_05900 [Trichuris suis]KFD60710.1 hypothetical protein M514_05900 [Trichuris suis]
MILGDTPSQDKGASPYKRQIFTAKKYGETAKACLHHELQYLTTEKAIYGVSYCLACANAEGAQICAFGLCLLTTKPRRTTRDRARL